jgi:hypothetical protein
MHTVLERIGPAPSRAVFDSTLALFRRRSQTASTSRSTARGWELAGPAPTAQRWLILAHPEMPTYRGEGVDERCLALGVPRRAPSRHLLRVEDLSEDHHHAHRPKRRRDGPLSRRQDRAEHQDACMSEARTGESYREGLQQIHECGTGRRQHEPGMPDGCLRPPACSPCSRDMLPTPPEQGQSRVFDGDCAFCGIGNVASPTWILDYRCQHGVCSVYAETGSEAENAA